MNGFRNVAAMRTIRMLHDFPRRLVCLLLLLAGGQLLAAPSPVAAQAAPPQVVPADSNQVVVSADTTRTGNLSTVWRDIRVDGTVEGDVTSITGSIQVTGKVTGDVVSYGGDVVLHATAQVAGSVLVLAGDFAPHQRAQVAGHLLSGTQMQQTSVVARFAPDSPQTMPANTLAGYLLLSITLGGLLLAVALLSQTLWQPHTEGSSRTLLVLPVRSLALGVLTTLLLGALLLPLSALLALTLVGLPLTLLLVGLLHLPYLYGLVVLARALARTLVQRLAIQPQGILPLSLAGSLLALGLALALGRVAPLWGLGLFYLAASVGLGAVLLSRGGALVPAVALARGRQR